MPELTLLNALIKIYGDCQGRSAYRQIRELLDRFPGKTEAYQDCFSQSDVVLITYGDSIKSRSGLTPLQTLHRFCSLYLKGAISTIHLLPFFPYSSDDGFSVKDFYVVDDSLGSWQDILCLGEEFKLMFDFVLNHVSSQSDWFRQYLNEEGDFKELAIEVDPQTDLSRVTRPRALPLLTPFKKKSGREVHVWTTFSADQVDINFGSVAILIKMIDVLLHYVAMGASILRMDAVTYLWKQIGTSCVHLENTHAIVKLFRLILDEVAPNVLILTETNVPHGENISYFGNGYDEAQMVYNFSLPPLLVHSFLKEDAGVLSAWAATLNLESPRNTFFNFTASHDGIGVRPLEGILDREEVDELIRLVLENGGQVSYKQNSDGSQSPYELNTTYIDAFLRGQRESDSHHARRFLASQAIELVLPGVPAIYIHSLLGTHNWLEGVKETGRARTINRQKLYFEDLQSELCDRNGFRAAVFYPYLAMIQTRIKHQAFHPKAEFTILNLHPALFAIRRSTSGQTLLCLTNVSSRPLTLSNPPEEILPAATDLLSGESIATDLIELEPYQSLWLEKN